MADETPAQSNGAAQPNLALQGVYLKEIGRASCRERV